MCVDLQRDKTHTHHPSLFIPPIHPLVKAFLKIVSNEDTRELLQIMKILIG